MDILQLREGANQWLCTGLSFQDFYQRCREAFLVNSDLTLRTQLTEFRDHKLIRTRKVCPDLVWYPDCPAAGPSQIFVLTSQGADGVEYLLVAVDAGTLMDFLENEDGNWEFKICQYEEDSLWTETVKLYIADFTNKYTVLDELWWNTDFATRVIHS